jgi:methionyl-tRNA formyltransferase
MTAAKILFAGTPEFALASLRALVDAGQQPGAVLTQPDRPAGRGKQLQSSPVKQFATASGLITWQPATLRDPGVVRRIADLAPDIIVVAAYGLILPQAVLDIPPAGCLNVHASLLPRWRGAAPIQAAILHGDAETGVSLMRMEAGLDTGPVYAMRSISIGDNETAGELHDRLAVLGGQLLTERFREIIDGTLQAVPQDDALASHAGKIARRDAAINWTVAAAEIARKIRAYNPVPGAYFECGGEHVKVFRAQAIAAEAAAAGTVITAGKQGIEVACGQGALRLEDLQRPGRRRISAAEFAAQSALTGIRLGNTS